MIYRPRLKNDSSRPCPRAVRKQDSTRAALGKCLIQAILVDVPAREPHHSVYVVLLNSEVLAKEKKFRDANPNCVPGWPCLYVGQTGKTPEQRLEDHKRGYRSNKYVTKYGVRLALEFLERSNPMTYDQSCAEEERLGLLLRQLGYATWWN